MDTWLIFFLLCFVGIAFMFYCMLRRQDALVKEMREEHAQILVTLRVLNARLDAGTGFGELEEYGKYGEGGREAASISPISPISPISVDEALDAYIRKERPDGTREPGKDGLPDLEL
jgi:hypothetical protein